MDKKHTLAQQFMEVHGLLHQTGRLYHHESRSGFNPQQGQGRVLALLKMQPEITQKELGYLLDMRNQSLGELLNKLERKGYITRSKSVEDRRTTNIKLTEEGRNAVVQTEQNKDTWEFLFDSLSDEEKNQLYDLLETLKSGLRDKVKQKDERFLHRGFAPFGSRPGFGGWSRDEEKRF